MKEVFFTFLLFSFSSVVFGQIAFEKGYFINNENERIICLIRNVDWRNNPTGFQYSLSSNGTVLVATIDDVKEFGIDGGAKYQRFKGNIERSSTDMNSLDDNRKLLFQEELLFLKVLVEGSATLYSYNDDNLRKYFSKTATHDIEQLVHKLYVEGGMMHANSHYQQQLLNDLRCEDIAQKSIEDIGYSEKPLVRIFTKYNSCKDPTYRALVAMKKDRFDFWIRPGVNVSSLKIENPYTIGAVDIGMNTSFRIGVVAEFILPFNKNKWAIFLEPTYLGYQSEADVDFGLGTHKVKADYKVLDFPLGLKYAVFLKNGSKLFFNTSVVYGYALPGSAITVPKREDLLNLEFSNSFSVVAGAGYAFANRFNIELRYDFNRGILNDYAYWASGFSSFSLVAGYRLF